jgi:hypothetical protein
MSCRRLLKFKKVDFLILHQLISIGDTGIDVLQGELRKVILGNDFLRGQTGSKEV